MNSRTMTSATAAAEAATHVVTPGVTPPSSQEEEVADAHDAVGPNARRPLQSALLAAASARPAPPAPAVDSAGEAAATGAVSNKRRRALFGRRRGNEGGGAQSSSTGRFGRPITTLPAVQRAYRAMTRRTGSVGGNGHGGAIYGEITEGSMQKMIELMKVHTDLGPESRFIDVGCGLGKPNIHVALDAGVEVSCGVEMEKVRWWLGMNNLDAVLRSIAKDKGGNGIRCMLAHADVTKAKTFDPFTHVYMFDIGFPPTLFYRLAEMYNSSSTPRYLICYHGPKLMVDEYGFDLELLAQTPTSMHGSSEGHMGYVYRRTNLDDKGEAETSTFGSGENHAGYLYRCPEHERERNDANSGGAQDDESVVPCDPLFYELLRSSTQGQLAAHVRTMIQKDINLVKDQGSGSGSDNGMEQGAGMGARKSGRKRSPPKKFAIEGYVYGDSEDEDEED